MKNFITALSSALLVAVIVTSLYTLVFASAGPIALFILSFLGMAAVALFNVRQSALRSGIAAAATAPAANQSRQAASGGRGGNSRDASSRGGRGRNERSGKPERSERKEASGGASKAATGAAAATASSASSPSSNSAPAEPAVIPDGPRETGAVKWFNRSKGFGFIIRDNGEEIFVHHRSIRNSDDTRRSNLRDGQAVNYIVADHSKGQQAEDVVGE